MPCIIDTARDGDRKVVIDIFNPTFRSKDCIAD
jgi:hypothetical protein